MIGSSDRIGPSHAAVTVACRAPRSGLDFNAASERLNHPPTPGSGPGSEAARRGWRPVPHGSTVGGHAGPPGGTQSLALIPGRRSTTVPYGDCVTTLYRSTVLSPPSPP
eukprot:766081-Hanusia_phi.AAC.2